MLAGALILLLAAAAPADATLEQVAAALHRSPAWRAGFTQRWIPAGFDEGAAEGGTLTLAFPARLRFDYDGPPPRVFATDGAIARHVDSGAASCTAVRLDAGAWGRLPLAAILDPGAARAAFAVSAAGAVLRLTAREPTPELATIEVVVGSGGLPARVIVVDGSGNRNEFSFSSWKAVPEPVVEIFRPSLPGTAPCSPDEG